MFRKSTANHQQKRIKSKIRRQILDDNSERCGPLRRIKIYDVGYSPKFNHERFHSDRFKIFSCHESCEKSRIFRSQATKGNDYKRKLFSNRQDDPEIIEDAFLVYIHLHSTL